MKMCDFCLRLSSIIPVTTAERFLGIPRGRDVVEEPVFPSRVLFPQSLLPELNQELPVGLLFIVKNRLAWCFSSRFKRSCVNSRPARCEIRATNHKFSIKLYLVHGQKFLSGCCFGGIRVVFLRQLYVLSPYIILFEKSKATGFSI